MSRFNEKCKGYENIIPFLAEEKKKYEKVYNYLILLRIFLFIG